MLYNWSYQLVALLFIFGITLHYLLTQKFPSRVNRYFLFFLILGILHNSFDMLGAYTISYSDRVPLCINHVVNLIFYQTLLLLPPAFLGYIFIKTEAKINHYPRLLITLFAPFVVLSLFLWANPITKAFFYFTANGDYFRGPFYVVLVALSGVYILAAFIALIKNRLNVRPAEYRALLYSLSINVVAVIIQNLYPQILIIGVALALSLLAVYLTMQNPVEMLDSTTRTFSRNGFVYYMSERVLSKKPYQFILVKLDDSHVINNQYGAVGGEKLMRLIAQYLQMITPKDSKVFRKLYDSFVVVTEYSDLNEFKQLVQRIYQKTNTCWDVKEYQVQLSTSVAYTHETHYFKTRNSAVESFFHAYYALKLQGRGSFIEFDASMIQAMVRHDEMEMLLRDALEKKRLEVHLQPIYGIGKSDFIYAEALARIRTQNQTLIMPKDFIPIAEKNGMISQISEQVMEQLFAYVSQVDLFNTTNIQRVSMNLSAIECEDDGLAKRILTILEKYHINPNRLSLEITETAALTSEKLPRMMHQLEEKGIIFMLDDLGSGYANVSALLRLPFRYVKLSRGTMLKAMNDERNAFVLQKSIEIIESLGLQMIAEGAETKQQVDFLTAIGVHYIQGFYYSRPVMFNEFSSIIKDNQFVK